jgi:hypothetical protein
MRKGVKVEQKRIKNGVSSTFIKSGAKYNEKMGFQPFLNYYYYTFLHFKRRFSFL